MREELRRTLIFFGIMEPPLRNTGICAKTKSHHTCTHHQPVLAEAGFMQEELALLRGALTEYLLPPLNGV